MATQDAHTVYAPTSNVSVEWAAGVGISALELNLGGGLILFSISRSEHKATVWGLVYHAAENEGKKMRKR